MGSLNGNFYMSKKYESARVVFSEKRKQIDGLSAQTDRNNKEIIFLDKELKRLYGMVTRLQTEAKIEQVETEIEKLETQVENLKKENKRMETKIEDASNKNVMENALLLGEGWKRENN